MNIIAHYPQTKAGQTALARRVASAQVAFVRDRFNTLTCPQAQKAALLQALLAASRQAELPNAAAVCDADKKSDDR